MRRVTAGLAAVAAMAAAACGGGGEESGGNAPAAPTPRAAAACGPVQDVPVARAGDYHSSRRFTAADYPTNPPAGGRHSNSFLTNMKIYSEPQPLGSAVHSLDHGAIVLWTNDLPPAAKERATQALNGLIEKGHEALIMVENPEMDVPMALTAWGRLQKCRSVDTKAIAGFGSRYYASGPEGVVACIGVDVKPPRCRR